MEGRRCASIRRSRSRQRVGGRSDGRLGCNAAEVRLKQLRILPAGQRGLPMLQTAEVLRLHHDAVMAACGDSAGCADGRLWHPIPEHTQTHPQNRPHLIIMDSLLKDRHVVRQSHRLQSSEFPAEVHGMQQELPAEERATAAV